MIGVRRGITRRRGTGSGGGGGGGGGTPAPTVPTVRSTSSGTSSNGVVPKPAGATVGDLLVVIHFQGPFWSVDAMTAPTGWTFDGQYATSTRIKVWHRVVDSSDAAASSYTFGYGGASSILCACVQAVSNSAPFNVAPVFGGGSTTKTQVAPSVTTTVANSLLLCGWGLYSGSTPRQWDPAPGMTEILDVDAGAEAASLDTLLLTTAGASGTKTATASLGENYSSVSMALAPA